MKARSRCMRPVTTLAVVVTLLVGCATTADKLRESDREPLTQSELEALFSERVRLKWWNSDHQTGTVVYRPDRTATVDWGSGSAEGGYRLVDGQFCHQWEKINDGEEMCELVYRAEGEGRYTAIRVGKNLDFHADWQIQEGGR